MKRAELSSDEVTAGTSSLCGKTPAQRTTQSPESFSSESINALTRKNVEIIAQLEQVANAQRSRADKIADAISRFVGSMTFVYLHVAWFGVWIALGTLPIFPESWRIDPFPFT